MKRLILQWTMARRTGICLWHGLKACVDTPAIAGVCSAVFHQGSVFRDWYWPWLRNLYPAAAFILRCATTCRPGLPVVLLIAAVPPRFLCRSSAYLLLFNLPPTDTPHTHTRMHTYACTHFSFPLFFSDSATIPLFLSLPPSSSRPDPPPPPILPPSPNTAHLCGIECDQIAGLCPD